MGKRRWHPETFVCAFRGHTTPAASAVLAEEDSGLGIDLPDGRRFARCLRCDAWISVDAPAADAEGSGVLRGLEGGSLPRRDKALREAIITRLIAVDRGLHSVLFAIIAIGALALRADLSVARHTATNWLKILNSLANQTGGNAHPMIAKELHRILTLQKGGLLVLGLTAIGYCVVEGAEAIGLWREKRWAEYLTALATAGFLPLEINELAKSVTVLKLVVLALNFAILIWLVIKKHLFGVGRHHIEAESIDVRAVFGPGTAGSPFVKAG